MAWEHLLNNNKLSFQLLLFSMNSKLSQIPNPYKHRSGLRVPNFTVSWWLSNIQSIPSPKSLWIYECRSNHHMSNYTRIPCFPLPNGTSTIFRLYIYTTSYTYDYVYIVTIYLSKSHTFRPINIPNTDSSPNVYLKKSQSVQVNPNISKIHPKRLLQSIIISIYDSYHHHYHYHSYNIIYHYYSSHYSSKNMFVNDNASIILHSFPTKIIFHLLALHLRSLT